VAALASPEVVAPAPVPTPAKRRRAVDAA
jgi:hypothetical protein